jgi:hypothetical protein
MLNNNSFIWANIESIIYVRLQHIFNNSREIMRKKSSDSIILTILLIGLLFILALSQNFNVLIIVIGALVLSIILQGKVDFVTTVLAIVSVLLLKSFWDSQSAPEEIVQTIIPVALGLYLLYILGKK